ncbi:MAG: pitrilysin family protein [Candidatus Omnitrophica bacterium]|nr:pitrilysin family protein [Candidatus Omnitrophota bacterium]MDD5487352.1 pitrilysin family protein [Candidatus Omnitrophota bacterium]
MRIIRALATLFVVFSLASSSSASGPDVRPDHKRSVLDNGTTVISSYIPDSGLVTIQIRVLSGLSNEGKYAGSGISHLLEHLIFKGSRYETPGELHKKIKMLGGVINGSTGLDSAEYHIIVPRENFDKAFQLLTSMVMSPGFSEEELKKEKEVILKEMRMYRDDPFSRSTNLLYENAYRASLYKYPVIGYEEVFSALTGEDVREYHAGAYGPDRMIVGIVGGVGHDEALNTAKHYLGAYPRSARWQSYMPEEPAQVSENIREFPAEVTMGYLVMGFHTTSLYSPDMYATDVLSIILGQGKDSRIYKKLVDEKELLYGATCSNSTPRYPGLFVISATGDADGLREARREIFDIIRDLAKDGPGEEEISKAKEMVIASYIGSYEDIGTEVSSLTSSEMLTGDPMFFYRYVENVSKVTASDVKRMIWKYLKKDNSTSILLMPEGKILGDQARNVTPSELEEKMVKLDNGMRIVVKRRGRLPIVSVAVAFEGGVRSETREDNGICNFVASVLLKGTSSRDASEIAPALERRGGSIGAFSGMNSLGVTMNLMKDDLAFGMDIVEDVIRNASFPEDEIERSRKKILAELLEEKKDVYQRAMNTLLELLYGEHPYGMNMLGTEDTVMALDRGRLTGYYHDTFVPDNTVISVVGDVNVDDVVKGLSERFGAWQPRRTVNPDRDVRSLDGAKEQEINMKKEQALVVMGYQGVKMNDERRYALAIISSLLSGSNGLLFNAAREGEGITYASGARSVPGLDKGYFLLYVATSEKFLDKASEILALVKDKVLRGEMSDEDIQACKDRLISEQAMSLQRNSDIAISMALNELYGLGYDDYKRYPEGIRDVTRDDVLKTAADIFSGQDPAEVLIHSVE